MRSKKRHRARVIKRGRMDNLQISWDYDTNPNYRYPVFLFTPDMDDTDTHYHIQLTRSDAVQLAGWLRSYIRDTGPRGKLTRRAKK